MAAEEDLKPLKDGEQLFAVISREAICPRPLVVAAGAAMLGDLTYTNTCRTRVKGTGLRPQAGDGRGREKPFLSHLRRRLVRKMGRFPETQALGGRHGVGKIVFAGWTGSNKVRMYIIHSVS